MKMNQSDFLRYDTVDINEPSLSKYLKEINETEETRSRCLELLLTDLKNLEEIEPCLDEEFLLPFLRVSKYDTSKALQRILKTYQQFEEYLNTYKKLSYPFHKIDSIRHMKISPYRCRDNSFLVMGNGAIDYQMHTFAQRFYLEVVCLYQLLENPVNQICGGTYIFDYEGMDIHGFLAFTPFWVKIFVQSLLNYPCRLKGVHLINTPSFYPLILKIAYPFLPKKIQNRVFFHAKRDNWDNLHAFIPPDILPEKYGGKLKNDELIDCLSNLKELDDKFRRIFAFGRIKTKKARLSLNVLQ